MRSLGHMVMSAGSAVYSLRILFIECSHLPLHYRPEGFEFCGTTRSTSTHVDPGLSLWETQLDYNHKTGKQSAIVGLDEDSMLSFIHCVVSQVRLMARSSTKM